MRLIILPTRGELRPDPRVERLHPPFAAAQNSAARRILSVARLRDTLPGAPGGRSPSKARRDVARQPGIITIYFYRVNRFSAKFRFLEQTLPKMGVGFGRIKPLTA